METAGFVTVHSSETDRRCKAITLTEKGKSQQETFRCIFMETEMLMVAGLEEDEVQQLHKLLNRVVTNLEEDRKT